MEARRYYVRYTLTGESALAVVKLRNKIARKYQVSGALRSPPHITLRYPFESDQEDALLRVLSELARDERSFTIPVTGFGSFDELVWYIDPAQDERLFSLKSRVCEAVQSVIKTPEQKYWDGTHFHITLAFRDVTPDTHRLIGEFLKDEPLPISQVTIDNVTLCRRNPIGPTKGMILPFGG